MHEIETLNVWESEIQKNKQKKRKLFPYSRLYRMPNNVESNVETSDH